MSTSLAAETGLRTLTLARGRIHEGPAAELVPILWRGHAYAICELAAT